MKKFIYISLVALAAVACQKADPVTPAAKTISIDPVITKANETNFEEGDKIGVTIMRGAEAFTSNMAATFDGTLFRSDVFWYTEGEQTSKFTAYYPYAAAVPATFTVAADQSSNQTASDFMVAVKDNVEPQGAVTMVFKHMLTRIVVNVDNQVDATIESVVLKNAKTKGDVDYETPAVTLAADAVAEDITLAAVTAGERYSAIVIPQTVELKAVVNISGKTLSKKLTSTTLKAGGQYTVNMTIVPGDIQVAISGEIENWSDEGTITDKVISFNEYLDAAQPYFEYDGVNYNVVKMKDGKWWMAQNLAFIPDECSVSAADFSTNTGIWYPCVTSGNNSVAPSTDASVIAAQGYFYSAAVAFGSSSLTWKGDETQAKTQGICPAGWHIPTVDDMTGLIGKCNNAAKTNVNAPYYNATDQKTYLLDVNADGINLLPYQYVSATPAYGKVMLNTTGVEEYRNMASMWYAWGSTGYNKTAGNAATQVYGLMISNVAASTTVAVGYLTLTFGAAVRCVRD